MSEDPKGHAECVATILMATDYIRKLETQGDAAQARVKELEAQVQRLERWASFSQCVIKSGEPWTETCERRYEAAVRPAKDGET